MEDKSIDKAAIVNPARRIPPGYMEQQPSLHTNQIHLQTDFTSPPPTHPHGIWLQSFSDPWQTQFRMPTPAPQANTTVTSTTTGNNNPPTFSSSSNRTSYSSYRSPLAHRRSFDNSACQQTPHQYGNTPRNNYPRQFSQNANFFANSPQNLQMPSSSSTQNWPQFNQRPRFVPRQHMRMNRPRSSIQNQSNRTYQETKIVIECKTRKRKLKSQQFGEPRLAQRPWNREDAVKAIAAEMKLQTPKNNRQIMIKFPDHQITPQIVQNFHTDIKSVHFHTPSSPRYCYVQVHPSANIEKVVNELNETFFQHEKLKVEIKESQSEVKTLPESIDPYTLYLGNLPTNISSNAVKDEFPKAIKVDVGFARKLTFARHAFIKFSNVEDAIQAYKEKYNSVIDGRPVMLRFRRSKRNVNSPGQVDKLPNEMNEFDIQSLQKKIKTEPKEENIDEYSPFPTNLSGVAKTEMMEKNEYEPDSINTSKVVKTEMMEENEYESILSEDDINIKTECPDYEYEYDEQYYEEEDTDISYTFRRNETLVEDEDRRWNENPDDKDEFDVPYSFVSKNQDEIDDGGSNKEDQRWNNLSDDNNDDNEKQTKGVDQHGQK